MNEHDNKNDALRALLRIHIEQFQVTKTRTNNNKCDALRALLRSPTEELEHFSQGLYRAISGFKKKNKH